MKIYNIKDSLEEKVINKARDLYTGRRFFDAYAVLMDAIEKCNHQSERLISACMELMYNTLDDQDYLQLSLYKMSLKDVMLSDVEYFRLLFALNSLSAESAIAFYLDIYGGEKAYKKLLKDVRKQIPNYKNCLSGDHVPKADKPDAKKLNHLSALLSEGRYSEIVDTPDIISPKSYYYVDYKLLQTVAYHYMNMPNVAYQICKDLYAETDKQNEQILHALIYSSLVMGNENAIRFYLQKYTQFCSQNWVFSIRNNGIISELIKYNRHQEVYDLTNFLLKKYPYSQKYHYMNAISLFKLGKVDEAKDIMSKLTLIDQTTFVSLYVLEAMDKYPSEVDYTYVTPPSITRRLESAFKKLVKLNEQDTDLADKFLAYSENVKGVCNYVLTQDDDKYFDVLCSFKHKAINKVLHKYLKSIYVTDYKKYKLLVAMIRAGYDIDDVNIVTNNRAVQVIAPNKSFFDKYSEELFTAYTGVMGVFLLSQNCRFHHKALNTAFYFFIDRINSTNAHLLNNKNVLERILCTLYCVFFFDDYVTALKSIRAVRFTVDDFNKSAKPFGLAIKENELYMDDERADIYMLIKKYNKKNEKKD